MCINSITVTVFSTIVLSAKDSWFTIPVDCRNLYKSSIAIEGYYLEDRLYMKLYT